MSTENFDNHFRKHLAEHETAVDSKALWNGVEAGLTGQRKPAAFWWIAGTMFLLFVAAGGLYFGLSPKNQIAEAIQTADKSATPEKSDHTQTATSYKPQPASDPPARKQEASAASVETNPKENQTTESGRSAEKSNPQPANNETGRAISEKEKTTAASKETAFGQSSDENEATQLFSGKEKTPTASETTAADHSSAKGQTSTNLSKARGDGSAGQGLFSLDTPMGINADDAHSESAENSITEGPVHNISDHRMPGAPDFFRKDMTPLPMRSLAAISLPGGLPLLQGERKPNPGLSYPYGEKRKYFVQFDVGGGLLQREIVSRHDDFNELARQRNNTEQPLEYLNAQLTLGMRFDNGLFWRSGVSISRFNEHFSLDRTRTLTEESEVLSNVHVNATGDSIFSYTTAVHTTVIKEDISHFNSYTLIDIPLYVGYDRDFGMWTLGAEVGAMLNLSMEARGTMMSPANDVIRIEDSGMFRDRVNWSATANLRLGRRISERLILRLSPGIRVLPGSILSVSVMDQHYTLFGGTFGMEYNF